MSFSSDKNGDILNYTKIFNRVIHGFYEYELLYCGSVVGILNVDGEELMDDIVSALNDQEQKRELNIQLTEVDIENFIDKFKERTSEL